VRRGPILKKALSWVIPKTRYGGDIRASTAGFRPAGVARIRGPDYSLGRGGDASCLVVAECDVLGDDSRALADSAAWLRGASSQG